MKKFVSILIIICLVFGAAITYTGCGANDAAEVVKVVERGFTSPAYR